MATSTGPLMYSSHVEVGLVPVADFVGAGTVATDIMNMKDHNRVRFLILEGAGGTGTYTVTVEACDDTTPSNTSAIPFFYRATSAAGTPGTITQATSSGFTSTAGANKIIEVEAVAESLNASGYGYIRCKLVEVVNDPITGAVAIEMLEPRNPSKAAATATT